MSENFFDNSYEISFLKVGDQYEVKEHVRVKISQDLKSLKVYLFISIVFLNLRLEYA